MKILSMKKTCILLLMFGLLTNGCQKDSIGNTDLEAKIEVQADQSLDSEYQNLLIQQYSKIIAVALQDIEFRGVLKSIVMQKFDGDYDVLAVTLHKQEYNMADVTIEEFLSSIIDKHFKDEFGKNSDSLLLTILQTIPNLQVSVPVCCEDWDIETHVPNVVPLDVDFDDQVDYIASFDADWNESFVGLKEDPEIAYVVVGVSERINRHLEPISQLPSIYNPIKSDNTTMLAPDSVTIVRNYQNELELYWGDVQYEDGYVVSRKNQTGAYADIATLGRNVNQYVDTGLTPGLWYQYLIYSFDSVSRSPYSRPIGKHSSFRRNGSSLQLVSMKFASKSALSQVETWVRGCPEIRLRFISGNTVTDNSVVTYLSATMEPPSRNSICNSDWVVNISLPEWNCSEIGDILMFSWQEEDNNVNQDYEINAQVEGKVSENTKVTVSGKATFKVSAKGDMGYGPVYFWDPLVKEYDLGGFKWKLKARND